MSSLPTSSTSSPSSSALTPTTRSRTLLFISYRDSSARVPRSSRIGRLYEDFYHPNDENEGLINHQGTPHTSIDVELPPKWSVRSESSYPRTFPIRLRTNKQKKQGGLR